ncbi:MAG: RNA-guided pseudouridylation complex pseudouridine synthase subunit Cbf5 [Halodesulfurarchaeum sp.]
MTELRPTPANRNPDELLEFGVVNLDKPPGPSAHEVSAWVRDLTGRDRAAHAGTLDPKVTGVLPTLLGTATRLVPALLEGEKEYVAVLELHDEPAVELDSTLAEFEGRIYQKPPRKSAVTRRLRVRTIHDLTALERSERRVLLRIRCEPGTYVRKLCHDIGLAIGTGAHMGDLRRTATEPFDDSSLVTLHDLADAVARWEEDAETDWLTSSVKPGERALSHLPEVTIARSTAEAVAHGAPVYAPGVIDASVGRDHDGLVACFTPDGSVVCLGRIVGDPMAESGEVVDLERVLV